MHHAKKLKIMRQSNTPKRLTKKEIALLNKKLGIDFSLLPKNYIINFYGYRETPDNYFLIINNENTSITIDVSLITSIVVTDVTTQINTSVHEKIRQSITLWNNVNHILSNTYLF